ncbi:MAG: DUF1294 domain-containing protein [Clostridia bacterium]
MTYYIYMGCITLLGGALGGTLAMYLFRHKTKKVYFIIVNIIGLGIQFALSFYFGIKFIT